MMVCVKPGCGAEVQDNEARCPACGADAGYPNVKLAAAESSALLTRVAAARAKNRKAAAQIDAFAADASKSKAVVNVAPGFLHQLFASSRALYATYEEQVDAGTRRPALPEDDRARTGVEGALFGSWGGQISYAALALDGRGLRSYGDVCLELKDVAVEDRTSVLEENSYRFVERHKILPMTPVPPGYRAPWAARADVAVAKLAERIKRSTKTSDHAPLLLRSTDDRHKDDFVEAHIFGTFNRDAIGRATVQRPPGNEVDRVLLQAAKEEAQKRGIVWRDR